MKNTNFISILIIFFIISITSIYSFSSYITSNTYSLIIKQSVFYFIGVLCILIIKKIHPDALINKSFYLYTANIGLLVLVLLFGTEINGTKAWFTIPYIGTFQPSEFMKIGLILYLAKIISEHKIKNIKSELVLIFKVFLITIIPSVFTFLEPDTGAILIYFVIAFTMLFVSKIRLRWFVILFSIIFVILGTIFYLYLFEMGTFINIFGSSLFYRFDRIFDWQKSSGMQLENSLIAIGSAGPIGKGINNIKLYFPEGHTDFIFTSVINTFGFIGAIVLIITIIYFDLLIIKTNTKKKVYKYIIAGFCGALFYQQIQNISMTIGLLPITGITLPFISYGGSSLISYMILLGIVLSIRKESRN